MPFKDPVAAAAYKAQWHQKNKIKDGVRERGAENQRAYRKRHRAKVKKYKLAYEAKRLLTDPVYREKQRVMWAKKSADARRLDHVKKYRAMHQKARQYRIRAGGALAVADVKYAIDSYRIGDRYLDVYTNELIEQPTIDHVVPLKSGGSNDWTNFAVTSAAENSRKGARSLVMFLLSQVKFIDARRGAA